MFLISTQIHSSILIPCPLPLGVHYFTHSTFIAAIICVIEFVSLYAEITIAEMVTSILSSGYDVNSDPDLFSQPVIDWD